MRQVSNKQAKRNRDVANIKKALPPYCAICGKPMSDAAHLVSKSMYPEHYTNPLNIVGLCRECHNKYDNNLAFRQRQKRLIERVNPLMNVLQIDILDYEQLSTNIKT